MVRQLSAQHSCHKETLRTGGHHLSRVACNFLETTIFMFFSGLLFRLIIWLHWRILNGFAHLFRESRAVMDSIADLRYHEKKTDSIADLRYHEKKHHKTYASKQMEGFNGTFTGNDVLYPRYRDFLRKSCKDGNGISHIFTGCLLNPCSTPKWLDFKLYLYVL